MYASKDLMWREILKNVGFWVEVNKATRQQQDWGLREVKPGLRVIVMAGFKGRASRDVDGRTGRDSDSRASFLGGATSSSYTESWCRSRNISSVSILIIIRQMMGEKSFGYTYISSKLYFTLILFYFKSNLLNFDQNYICKMCLFKCLYVSIFIN
jgi:hypothetical protein